MTEGIEHIARALPPWRDRSETLTECGKKAAEFAAVLTREQAVAKIKQQGRQRAAMSTCMTCWETASRHGDWDNDPCGVIEREAHSNFWRKGPPSLLERELRAFALMCEAHPEEFAEVLAGLDSTVSLDEARRAKRVNRGGVR